MSWSNEVTRQTFTPVSLSTFTAVCQSPLSSLLPLPLNVLSSFHHNFLSKRVHHSGSITHHPSPLLYTYTKSDWGRRQWASGLDICWVKFKLCFHPDSNGKASDKSWVLLKQRDKVPTTEIKEDFPVCTCSGRFLGVEKGGYPTP